MGSQQSSQYTTTTLHEAVFWARNGHTTSFNPAADQTRTDYSLNNPDTLTKYKTAGQISEKVLAEVSKLCVPGAKIVDICQKGDKLLEEEVGKVYRGKKITKGSLSAPLISNCSLAC